MLAEKVSRELNKPFIFIRTNVDDDLTNAEENEGPQFNENSVLREVRRRCFENLQDVIHDENDVCTIDNENMEKYFDDLVKSISSNLPQLKRKCFILSCINATHKSIKRKAELLKGLSCI